MECYLEKNYQVLIISGECNDESVLKEAWGKIYTEYLDLTNDGSYNEVFEKILEINFIHAKVFFVDHAISHLVWIYSEDLNQKLNNLGLNTQITKDDDRTTRAKKMIAVRGRVKRWLIDQDILQKELDQIQAENAAKEGGKYYFEDQLDAICQYRKYSIKPNEITTVQFIKALKSVERYVNERMRAQNI